MKQQNPFSFFSFVVFVLSGKDSFGLFIVEELRTATPSLSPSNLPNTSVNSTQVSSAELTFGPSSNRPTTFNQSASAKPTHDNWSFIILADWHNAEDFAINPGRNSKGWKRIYDSVRYMYDTYEGDLVVLPGDSNNGKWDTKTFAEKYKPDITVQERVLEAGRNCYGTMKDLFAQAGYDTILMAVGDHELGGNAWGKNSDKVASLPEFRKGFTEGFNRMPITGEYIFKKPIGFEPCRPVGTDFEDTSYAYQHKNVLFITVDAFFRMPTAYFDRENGLGGEGVITCTVEGDHLKWFENVLIEARKDNTVKHIIVQAHLPVLQPVRKVSCSGQFMDNGEVSEFWQTMVKYNVDVYLAGEVHTTTVTKDTSSNLLQIISRGNSMNNFLKVDVTDSTLKITAYNEIGPKDRYNMNYTVHGSLLLDKAVNLVESNFTTSPRAQLSTVIHASGVLELLDRTSALVRFKFEKKIPLRKRQVIGMKDDEGKKLNVENITIRGRKASKSIRNKGSFGQQYDAQVAELKITKPGVKGSYYAKFSEESRLGIYATGPHAAGGIISFTLWFKTENKNKMILVHYGHNFSGVKTKKNIFTLTLDNGSPILYSSPTTPLKTLNVYSLNDGQWHHLAVSMPRKSCRLSEVNMYINGKSVETTPPSIDMHLFFATSGSMGIGGFGYSSGVFETIFPNLELFIGGIDEFYLWSKPLQYNDLHLAMKRKFKTKSDTTCNKEGIPHKLVDVVVKAECIKKCKAQIDCWGFQRWTTNETEYCIHFQERPKSYNEQLKDAKCGISI